MGILNVTPDSFSDGGRYQTPDEAFIQASRMVAEGADILDLGAESTRPGAEAVTEEEELKRLLPCLKRIISELPVLVSIDTTKSAVATACLSAGAHIINDVSGLTDSGLGMIQTVKEHRAGLVLMHRRGNPKTMQSQANYKNVTAEVLKELSEALHRANGLDPEQIVIDPGLGFSKTPEQTVEILRNIREFHKLGRPVLIGPSRKSFLGKITDRETSQRDISTAAVCVQAVLNGVQILRVHEVGAMRDAVRVAEVMRGERHVRT